jgi:hypothetical protein
MKIKEGKIGGTCNTNERNKFILNLVEKHELKGNISIDESIILKRDLKKAETCENAPKNIRNAARNKKINKYYVKRNAYYSMYVSYTFMQAQVLQNMTVPDRTMLMKSVTLPLPLLPRVAL